MSRAAARRRQRRDIERRLAECGLISSERRPAPGAAASAEHDEWGERLRRALEELGGGFALFGRYLASRADLLPARACLALDEIPDRGVAAPAVLERIAGELRRPAEDAFAEFDETPFEVRILDQVHRARLPDGRDVVVRLAHPGLDETVERDFDALPLLRPAFREGLGRDFPLDKAILDLCRGYSDQRDFTAQAASLELFSQGSVPLAVPEVLGALTTPRLMTIAQPVSSRSLEDTGVENRRDLARDLFLIWLEQALVAGTLLTEGDVQVLGDGRLTFTGAVCALLPASSRRNLWEYLRHTAAHRPEESCDHLLRELRPRTGKATETDLRQRLRQIVPYRDGGWSERGDTVAEYLILHWRLARQCGFEPSADLQDFYRGLFWATRLSRRLAPRTDPLREAHEDLRWIAGWQRIRAAADPRQLAESLESNLARWVEVPEKLDRLLATINDEGIPLRLQLEESASARQRRSRTAAAIALALTMAALALVASRLSESGLPAVWVERVGAVVFLALGALLLRIIMR